MNTNQSKRKKEFNRSADEKAFAAHINNFRIHSSAKSALSREQLLGRILRQNDENITLNYTDNTQFFGEDYQTEKQS